MGRKTQVSLSLLSPLSSGPSGFLMMPSCCRTHAASQLVVLVAGIRFAGESARKGSAGAAVGESRMTASQLRSLPSDCRWDCTAELLIPLFLFAIEAHEQSSHTRRRRSVNPKTILVQQRESHWNQGYACFIILSSSCSSACLPVPPVCCHSLVCIGKGHGKKETGFLFASSSSPSSLISSIVIVPHTRSTHT